MQQSQSTTKKSSLCHNNDRVYSLASFFLHQRLWVQFITLLIIVNSVRGLSVGPPLPIMHFEPSSIETGIFYQILGSHKLVQADDSLITSDFLATFDIIPQRVNINNLYSTCVGGWRDFQVMINHSSTGVQFNFAMNTIYNQTAAICKIMSYKAAETSFTSSTINYFLYSLQLANNRIFFSQSYITIGVTCLLNDGIVTPSISKCRTSMTIPSLNYKVFAFLKELYGQISTSPTLAPCYRIQSEIIDINTIQFTLILQYFKFQSLSLFFIFIKDDLFDTTQRKPLMFSLAIINHPENTVSPYSFSIPFPHFISDKNMFIGITSYRGFQYSLIIQENNPPDINIKGTSNVIGNSVSLFALSFYAFSQLCPPHLTMPCQTCPQNCKTCHVQPNFHCFQCHTNFTLSPDKLSCTCPLTIVGQFCNNFPFGCTTPKIQSSTGDILCGSCDFTKQFTLVGNDCHCISGYFLDPNNWCKNICGDGIVVESQECDDGNNLSGDGCSADCHFEQGIYLDTSKNPPIMKSQLMLKYKVEKIIKKEFENSAKLYLTPNTLQALPFGVKMEHFDPISANINFKIIISTNPYEETVIKNFTLTEIDQNNQMIIDFNFDSNVEGLSGQITLNYQNTNYKNETQILNFQLKGDNQALKVTQNAAAYKTLGNSMLAVIILNVICLLIGFFSSKFIGLETILTCQLIYYSQLLIIDIAHWPSGFTFLKYLKYSSGYNGFLQFTDYRLFSTLGKKMYSLGLKKLVIENFNLSFIILFIVFVCLIICSIIRKKRQNSICQELRELKNNKAETLESYSRTSSMQLSRLDKINQISFWIANQICLWLLLPLISAVSAEFLIPNNQFSFHEESDKNNALVRIRGQILLLSLFMIFCVLLNNFKNTWLSASSHKQLLERPEEMTYKNLLFIYLLVTGMIIFFFNNKQIGPLFSSVIVCGLHLIFILALVKIDPYKQSLKVHTVTLFINHGIVLVFLIVVNLLNYIQDLDEMVGLGFGFFLTGGSGLSLISTFVRLYYDLRYGKQLEEKIMEEKESKKQKDKQDKQMRIKNNEQKLQKQAKLKKTQEQKVRDKNVYLQQNIKKEDYKMDYFEWLQERKWDQKMKDKEYFKKFDEKPLYYLKTHDRKKYDEIIENLEEKKNKQRVKKEMKINDPEYKQTVGRLRKQMNAIKEKKKHRKQIS